MVSLITVILKHKKLVIAVTMSAFAVSAAVSMLIPQRFVSSAIFLPAGVEKDISGLRDFFSSLGRLGEVSASFIRTQKNMVIDHLIRSRRMSNLMAEQFDLGEVYGEQDSEAIQEKLREKTGVSIRGEGVIVLSVEARSPELAKRMVEGYLANLDSILVHMTIETSESRLEFLEEEIIRRKSRLAESDSVMKEFQTEHGVYEIEEQARSVLGMAAMLSTRFSMLDVEKSLLEMTMKPGTPELERVRLEWELVRDQLLGIKEGTPDEQQLFPPLDEFPELSYRYASLMIDKRVQEFVLAYLQLQHMDAMITANQRLSSIKIIDPPYFPERRVWPRRKQIVIVSTLAALAWICLILVVREQWRKGAVRFDPYPQRADLPDGDGAREEG
jgi:capsule polysaccharide export protein KpsE/RkpR